MRYLICALEAAGIWLGVSVLAAVLFSVLRRTGLLSFRERSR